MVVFRFRITSGYQNQTHSLRIVVASLLLSPTSVLSSLSTSARLSAWVGPRGSAQGISRVRNRGSCSSSGKARRLGWSPPPAPLSTCTSYPPTPGLILLNVRSPPHPQGQDHLMLLWVPTSSSDCTPLGLPVTRVSHTGHLCPRSHMPSPL